MSIKRDVFGKTKDGFDADIFALTNTNGIIAKITNYGGIITELHVPGKDNKLADVVLGYNSLEEYIEANPYFGALVGRFANRIANAKFSLDGTEYVLAANNGQNHLHGGTVGFDKVTWKAETIETDQGPSLRLSYTSPDGEEGYPGKLDCTVTYTLTNENELKIEYSAQTDKPTIVNLTNHSYFNLAGQNAGDILSHEVYINADNYTPVSDTLIPTGEIAPVKGTPLDFTTAATVGSRIDDVPGGYDHNYILNKSAENELSLAATAYEPGSGRFMEVLTTEPAMQLYTGNFLDGSHSGKGAKYNKNAAFCMETQHYPDSPNQPSFPSVVLRPGEKYSQVTIYRFSVK